MRALGRGSVSSFLKVILDVFHIVLWVGVAVATLGVFAALLLSVRPDIITSHIDIDQLKLPGQWIGPALAALCLMGDLYLVAGIVMVGRLRRIFATLIAGDPFHPANAGRLRVIAGALAALELGRYAASAISRLVFDGALHVSGGVSLTTWFAVLVLLVLAEVFREGARLRGEAELTI